MKKLQAIVFASLLLASASAVADKMMPQEAPVAQTAPEKPAEDSVAVAAVTSAVTAQKWDMLAEKSSITFHGKQMGTDFEGVISKFTAEIYFDADHLDQSAVSADIDIGSIDAKDGERNKSIKGSDWFDVEHFPTARFETTGFTKNGEGSFTADATLTIHGVSVPVQLPFTLAKQKVGFGQDRMVMTGTVTLDRSKFKLGQGDWADPSVIANEVPVDIKVTATAAEAAATPPKPATP